MRTWESVVNRERHFRVTSTKDIQNIAEAPKNAVSALLGASLGEDKYFLIF